MMTVEDVISAYRDLDAPVALSQESEEALFKRFNDVIVQIYSARALEKYWEVVALWTQMAPHTMRRMMAQKKMPKSS